MLVLLCMLGLALAGPNPWDDVVYPPLNGCNRICMQCSQNPPFTCLRCPATTVLTQQGSCHACPSGCLMCQGAAVCTQCYPGYALVTASLAQQADLCHRCDDSCSECEVNLIASQDLIMISCTKCFGGFYLTLSVTDNQTYQCSPCGYACYECLDALTCTKCLVGFGLDPGNNTCIPCGGDCYACNATACTFCNLGYYLNQALGTCSTCGGECAVCSSPSMCTRCQKGFYLLDNGPGNTTCNSCPSSCLICFNQTACLECVERHYMNTTKTASSGMGLQIIVATCQPCTPNCFQCYSGSMCQFCDMTYFSNMTSGLCEPCMPNCYGCFDYSQCYNCFANYYPINLTCQSCGPDCAQCHLVAQSTGEYLLCLSCRNQTLAPYNSQCMPCLLLSDGCLTCTSSDVCLSCLDGYKLTGNFCVRVEQASTISILMFTFAGIVILIAAIFAVCVCCRSHNRGQPAAESPSTVKPSYFEIL